MLILKTKRTIIEGREMPAFELCEGELISVLVDSMEFESVLKDYLTGERKHPDIEIIKDLCFVGYKPQRISLMDRLTGKTLARHIVKKELRFEDSKISKILEKAQIASNWTYKSLAGNPRRILSTLMAIEKGYSVIYTTAGMDPMGVERIHQIVKDEIRNHKVAAIEINTPDIQGNRILPKADKLIEIK